MRIDIITIFPEYFEGPLGVSLLGRAIAEGLVEVHVHDLRRWATDRHRTVDDTPYGGGPGMVMRADVWFRALEEVWGPEGRIGGPRPRTILLTPRGRPLDQALVRELAQEPRLVLLCGRYEGVDERVAEAAATDEISIGDYVLAGGEAAALVVVEATTRLIPGVVGNASSPEEESFADDLLEYPQYTRPVELYGLRVPEVLLSGDHGAIARWRRERAIADTRARRPDLYERWRRRHGDV